MGLFDFLRGKKIEKSKNYFKKLDSEIFPEGERQINDEVLTLHKKLNGKYSLQDLEDNYKYIAYMFNVTKDKSSKNIYKLISNNPNNVVLFEDLEAIINYIKNKDKVELPKQSYGRMSMTFTQISISALKLNDKYNSSQETASKYEMLIFFSADFYKQSQVKFPNDFEELERENYNAIFNNLKNINKFIQIADEDFNAFKYSSDKYGFYKKQIELLNDNDYDFNILYHNLVKQPLKLNQSKEIYNNTEVMEFKEHVLNILDEQRKSFDKMKSAFIEISF